MPRRTDQAPSIRRALELHQGRGIVRTFETVAEPGRPRRWVVTAEGVGTQEFTDAEAMAFCLGLAAAHQRDLALDLPSFPAGAWVRVTTENGGEGVFRLERDHRAGQTLVADRMRVDVEGEPRVIETRTRIEAERIVAVLADQRPRLMALNPEPLVVMPIPTCRHCGMRAPWCTCGRGPIGGYR